MVVVVKLVVDAELRSLVWTPELVSLNMRFNLASLSVAGPVQSLMILLVVVQVVLLLLCEL